MIPCRARLLGAVSLICITALSCGAQESRPTGLEEALKSFRATQASPAEPGTVAGAASFLREWDGAQNQLANLESYFDNNDFTSAARQARQYARQTRTPEIKKLWEDLAVAIAAEQKVRETTLNARIEDELKAAGARLLSAVNPAEVDAITESLYALQDSLGNNYTPRLQRNRNRLSNAVSFAHQWQDALAFLDAGDIEGARNQLRNLSNSGSSERLIPRAKIVARSAELRMASGSSLDDALKGATLANLDEYRERLAVLQESASGRRSTELHNALAELDRLVAAVEALDDGRAGDGRAALKGSTSSCGSQPSYSLRGALGGLKAQWFMRALPALTGLDDLSPKNTGENALAYVRRQFDAAAGAGDWDRAYRFAMVEKDMKPANAAPCAVREQTTGADAGASLGAWLKARLMEKAAQPGAAAALYRDALKHGAPPKLEESIVARLRELATEFPETAREAR